MLKHSKRGWEVATGDDGSKIHRWTGKGDCTELKEYAGILGQIQQIEDALTRVQAKKQKAIETIHKFGYDDAKLELATMQLELQIMKQDGGSHETADDGFMDAMNATASEVWGDQDVWKDHKSEEKDPRYRRKAVCRQYITKYSSSNRSQKSRNRCWHGGVRRRP